MGGLGWPQILPMSHDDNLCHILPMSEKLLSLTPRAPLNTINVSSPAASTWPHSPINGQSGHRGRGQQPFVNGRAVAAAGSAPQPLTGPLPPPSQLFRHPPPSTSAWSLPPPAPPLPPRFYPPPRPSFVAREPREDTKLNRLRPGRAQLLPYKREVRCLSRYLQLCAS